MNTYQEERKRQQKAERSAQQQEREAEILHAIQTHLTRLRVALRDDFQLMDDDITKRIREQL